MRPDFTSLVRPVVLEVQEYSPGATIEEVRALSGRQDIARLSFNENALGVSPKVTAAMEEALKEVHRYPNSAGTDIRAVLARKMGLQENNFLFGNGLDDILNLLGMTFLNPGDEVVVPEVTFSVYAAVARMMGADVVEIPLRDDYSLDARGMLEAATEKTKMIFICNPNNPTGSVMSSADLEMLLKGLPDSTLLVVDEAYHDYVRDPDFPHACGYIGAHPNLLVLWTFSKLYGLAGLRLGCAVGHPDLLGFINRVRAPYTVNSIAQAAAVAALEDEAYRIRIQNINAMERERLGTFLRKWGVRFIPSEANFLLIFPEGKDGIFAQKLMEKGILVRLWDHPKMCGALRISIGSPEENNLLMQVLRELL